MPTRTTVDAERVVHYLVRVVPAGLDEQNELADIITALSGTEPFACLRHDHDFRADL